MTNQFALLKDRRFVPLFLTMFLGAFNDNLFKALMVVMVAYGVIGLEGWTPEVLVSAAAGVFILPFILMAPLGGALSDKFDKARVMFFLKVSEVMIVIAAAIALWFQSFPALLGVLFLFGAQSALFAPGKYSILPQHLKPKELIGANGVLNSGSFVAILLGNILGSLWGVSQGYHVVALTVLALCAAVGLIASRSIPPAPALDKTLVIRKNAFADMWVNFKLTTQQHKGVMVSLFGIAWFYFVGGTFLAQFPNYTKQTLAVDNVTLSVFMALFTLGIGLGGLLNNTVLKSKITGRYVPLAALGIAVFTADLYGASRDFEVIEGQLRSFSEFVGSSFHAWRIMFDLVMVSVCGGLFVVPLNAILQERSDPKVRARIVSASSVMDATFVLLSAVAAMIMFSAGFKVVNLFFALALACGVAAIILGCFRSVLEEKKD